MTMKHIFRVSCALIVPAIVVACRAPEIEKTELVKRADASMEQKKYAEAIVDYRKAVQLDTRYGEAREKLALAYLQTGEKAGAAREFILAADLLPDDPKAQLNAARVLLNGRQFEEAQSRIQKALATDPKHVEGLILRANALAGLNQLDEAVENVQDAIRSDPDRMQSY